MAYDNHINLGFSTVATAPSPATTGTSLVLAAGGGAKMPAAPFNITISPAGATRSQVATQSEIARVTAKSTDTLTLIRATEGPNAARSIIVGDEVAVTITAKDLTDVETNAADKTSGSAQIFSGAISTGPSAIAPGVLGLFISGGTTVAAGSSSGQGMLGYSVSGDTQYRFWVGADGLHQWGPGSGGLDTTLYRGGAGQLQTGSAFQISAVTVAAAIRTNQASGQYVLGQKLLAADANSAFVIRADGWIGWGPGGASALDTNLYRITTGTLRTDTDLSILGSYSTYKSATGNAFVASLQSDTQMRFIMDTNGSMNWGPGGTTAQDVYLVRSGANTLLTNGLFVANNGVQSGTSFTSGISSSGGSALYAQSLASNGYIIAARQGTDTTGWRFTQDANGGMAWGPGGTSAIDTTLYRSGPASLQTDGSLNVGASLTLTGTSGLIAHRSAGPGNTVLAARGSSDTADRFSLANNGNMNWGGGSGSADTNLYRSAASTLKTDGNLVVAGTLTAPGLSRVQYRKTTAKSALNTTTATDLLNGEITIAANVIGATGSLRFTFFGDKVNNSGLTSFCDRFQLIFGGVTLIDTGGAAGTAVLTASATRFPWFVRGVITNTATNAQVVHFEFVFKSSAVTSSNSIALTTGEGYYDVQATTHMAHAVGYNTAAVDTTAAQALVFNVINGTATATNETKLTSALIEII